MSPDTEYGTPETFMFSNSGRYIETGSLISIKSNIAEIVLPSEEIRMALNPLDFEEFLDVIDESGMIKETIQSHYESLTPLGDGVHREIMKLFRTYMLVGGMPQAVSHYAETKDFLGVRRIQQNILALYREDISRYAGESEMKVRLIFDDIPSQLSSHQKRFKLASLKKTPECELMKMPLCGCRIQKSSIVRTTRRIQRLV